MPNDIVATYGRECIELIRKEFYIPEQKLYAEEVTLGETPVKPAFNWGVGVMLSALNAAARVDGKYRPWMVEYADATRVYWNETGPVAGYDVLPMPKPVDRYYDDNAWMAMALLESYQISQDAKYLAWAKGALAYTLSGEDRARKGGVFWRESDKGGYACCSSGPAAAASASMYRQTREPTYLSAAKRIYAWTKSHLQDPKDFLFWDAVSPQGKIERAKWSYNTALMIRAAADLFSLTKDEKYKKDLIEMQSASAKKWLGTDLRDEGRFAHLLLESWIWQRRWAPVRNPDQAESDYRSILTPLAWLHGIGRNEGGFYGKRWDTTTPPDQKTFALLDQASAARAFFLAADYYKSR